MATLPSKTTCADVFLTCLVVGITAPSLFILFKDILDAIGYAWPGMWAYVLKMYVTYGLALVGSGSTHAIISAWMASIFCVYVLVCTTNDEEDDTEQGSPTTGCKV